MKLYIKTNSDGKIIEADTNKYGDLIEIEIENNFDLINILDYYYIDSKLIKK